MSDADIKEMEEYFKLRTRAHLYLVYKWTNKIANYVDWLTPDILVPFIQEAHDHDRMKWKEPEYTSYLYITWRYKCQREGRDFVIDNDMLTKMHEATYHHIKTHKHHPEYWDDTTEMFTSLSKENRDGVPSKIVDATKMPLPYVASMVADWFAMSEELGSNPKDWADKNINVRWKFTDTQKEFIYLLIDKVWMNK